jgi:hypothetical protein
MSHGCAENVVIAQAMETFWTKIASSMVTAVKPSARMIA